MDAKPKLIDLAIVGATGAVGEMMLKILEQRNFPVGQVFPLASIRSMGKSVKFRGKSQAVLDLANFDFSRCSLALFSAGGTISTQFVPKALAAGCLVVDNTSKFRLDKEVPLIVAEVNPEKLQEARLLANPNCSTMGLLVAVKPLYDKFGVSKMEVSTYQAVSGAGKQAIDTLASQAINMLRMNHIKEEELQPFPNQIAFNLLPQIGDFLENGYTSEEMKMVNETQRILDDDKILVNVTCVRVPVFYGHSMTVNLELTADWSVAAVRQVLAAAPGLTLMPEPNDYPTPLEEGSDKDDVYVGRVRRSLADPKCVTFWLVSDNLRKGAALNSVQLAELALQQGQL